MSAAAQSAQTQPSLYTRVSHFIWGTPEIACKWVTGRNREYEIRLLKQGCYLLAEFFNPSRNQLLDSASSSRRPQYAETRECVQKWKNRDMEIRLFRNSYSDRLDAVVVNVSRQRLAIFSWNDLSEHQICKFQNSIHPRIESNSRDKPQSVEFGDYDDIASSDPDQRWELSNDRSDANVIRRDIFGDERELVHIVPEQGFHGQEDIQVIRQTLEGGVTILVCQIFNRVTRNAVDLPCENLNGRARLANPSGDLIARIQNAPIASLTYNTAKQPIKVLFCEPERIVTFAGQRGIAALSDTEIKKWAVHYFRTPDENGQLVELYDEGTLSVSKQMSRYFSSVEKPVVFIEFRRSLWVRSFKPIWSFIETLWGGSEVTAYRPYGETDRDAMEDLVLRHETLADDQRQYGRNVVEKTFTRCTLVRLAIACDRSNGRLAFDSEESFLLRWWNPVSAAQVGYAINNGVQSAGRFLNGGSSASTNTNSSNPSLRVPYERTGSLTALLPANGERLASTNTNSSNPSLPMPYERTSRLTALLAAIEERSASTNMNSSNPSLHYERTSSLTARLATNGEGLASTMNSSSSSSSMPYERTSSLTEFLPVNR